MYLELKKVSPLAWSLAREKAVPEAAGCRAKDFNFTAPKVATKFHRDVYNTLRIALSRPSVYKEEPEERYFDARGDSEN